MVVTARYRERSQLDFLPQAHPAQMPCGMSER
jgi:hypothetical protein